MRRRPRNALLRLVLAAAALPAAALPREPVLEVVGVYGDPVPGAPSAHFGSLAGGVATSGRVVFWAGHSNGNDGYWWYEPSGSPVRIVLEGDFAPDLGAPLANLTFPALDGSERIFFGSQLGGALWRWDGAGLLGLLLARGDPAPDAGPGASFDVLGVPTDAFFTGPALLVDEAGTIAFLASVAGPGISEANDDGIWILPPSGSPELVVREQDPAPGGGSFSSVASPSMNALGEIAFLGNVAGLRAAPVTALFAPSASGQLVRRAAVGDDAIGAPAGSTFTTLLANPQLDDLGNVAFRASFSGGGRGIWLSLRSGELVPIAVQGRPAPAALSGAVWESLPEQPVLGDGGHLAFYASTRSTDYRSASSIWRWHPQTGLELVAASGAAFPGEPARLGTLELGGVSPLGDVVFTAFGEAIDGTSARLRRLTIGGVFFDVFGVPGGRQIPLLRYGNAVETARGERRIITFAQISRNGTRGRAQINAAGDVLIHAHLSSQLLGLLLARAFADADGDADGARDLVDRCPLAPDPDQADRDGDGLGDACNDALDRDGDDFADALDNCTDAANDQRDGDGDALGDACDAFPADSDNEQALLRRELAFAEQALGEAFDELGRTELDLAQAEAELRLCLERRVFIDADGDAEDDARDACPATPAGAARDGAGCSLEQFCAGFASVPACSAADWRNDELLGNPHDCSFAGGSCRPTTAPPRASARSRS